MRKILLTIVLAVLFSTAGISQVTYVDTLANGADTTYTLRLRAVYPWVSVVLENLGTGEDTLTAKVFTFVKNLSTGAIIDTSFSALWIKDSNGDDVDTLFVAQGATVNFLIMRPITQAIEVALLNTTAGNTRVMVEAWKPD